MRLGFISILALHWAVVFALLAYGSIAYAGGHALHLLESLGIERIDPSAPDGFVLLSVLLAGNFAFAALLFGWVFVSSLLPHPALEGDHADLSRLAYCAAISSLTIILVASVLRGKAVPYAALAAQLAALAACYVASFAERLHAALTATPAANDVKAAARLMALGAAHGAMLSRITGRELSSPDGAR